MRATTMPARMAPRGKRMPAGALKVGMAFAGGLLAAIPQAIREGVIVLTLFITLDTITGVYLAARKGAVSSHTMREQLSSKLFQYASFIGLGGGMALLSHQWALLGAGIGVCLCCEASSIIETLLKLEKMGGAPLGPARPFLLRVEKYFDVAVVETREVTTTTTTVMAVAVPAEPEKEKVQ